LQSQALTAKAANRTHKKRRKIFIEIILPPDKAK